MGQADVKDCRGFDPPEDTERLFKLVGEATQEKNCRGFDPPEDTESLHFCQYRWSVIWHCRGFDPPEDTERTSQSATIAATGLIAEASIRLRILKAGTNQNKPGVAIEIAEASIRLRILKGLPDKLQTSYAESNCRGFDPAEDTERTVDGDRGHGLYRLQRLRSG